jgi:hypothetical protein
VLQSFAKTSSRLFQHFGYLETSGQSSSLKATGYKGYNLSINVLDKNNPNSVKKNLTIQEDKKQGLLLLIKYRLA